MKFMNSIEMIITKSLTIKLDRNKEIEMSVLHLFEPMTRGNVSIDFFYL